MTGIVNSTGARSGVIGTTVGTAVGGKIVNHWNKSFTLTATTSIYTLTGTMAKITFGGSNDLEITGITATEGNWLWMSVQAGGLQQPSIDGFYTHAGFRIDTSTTAPASDFMCAYWIRAGTNAASVNIGSTATWQALIPVPASYTSKTAQVICAMQAAGPGYGCESIIYVGPVNTDTDPDNIPWRVSFNILEIEA
jgi:hypothetical protein